MNIEDLTIKEAREIAKLLPTQGTPQQDAHRFEIGENYFIQTVTHYWVGEITHVGTQEIELRDASWVADMGRFAKCLKEGVVSEMEPCPDGVMLVGRGALISATRWRHDLPRDVK